MKPIRVLILMVFAFASVSAALADSKPVQADADRDAALQAAIDEAAWRKTKATDFAAQLNAMFAGKLIRKSWRCSMDRDVITGCNGVEYAGPNWLIVDPAYPAPVKFEVSVDGGKILFFEGHADGPEAVSGFLPPQTGTPEGPLVDDIRWADKDGKPVMIVFWTSDSNLLYYMIYDAPVPHGAPGFDPDVRYQYWKHEAS